MSKLTEAIQTKNIRGIKSAILAYLSADPLDRSGEIKQAIATIDATGIAMWEQHDGTTPLFTESVKWTKDYFAELQAHLITNFSKEGVELALKVGRHAYREELNRPKEPTGPSRPSSKSQSKGGNDDAGKYMMAGAAVVVVGIALYLILK
ncbi:MAG: hypothetical protein ABS949_09030 [Solibacillus sp.]